MISEAKLKNFLLERQFSLEQLKFEQESFCERSICEAVLMLIDAIFEAITNGSLNHEG